MGRQWSKEGENPELHVSVRHLQPIMRQSLDRLSKGCSAVAPRGVEIGPRAEKKPGGRERKVRQPLIHHWILKPGKHPVSQPATLRSYSFFPLWPRELKTLEGCSPLAMTLPRDRRKSLQKYILLQYCYPLALTKLTYSLVLTIWLHCPTMLCVYGFSCPGAIFAAENWEQFLKRNLYIRKKDPSMEKTTCIGITSSYL